MYEVSGDLIVILISVGWLQNIGNTETSSTEV